jgi:hypothetical protein
MNTIAQGKSMLSRVYIHKPIDWLGEGLPDQERMIFTRIKLQMTEFLSSAALNSVLMLKIVDEVNQLGISMYVLKEVIELLRIKLLSTNSKKVYLTITLVDSSFLSFVSLISLSLSALCLSLFRLMLLSRIVEQRFM